MASALGLTDAAVASSSAAVDARLAGGAVITAATLTATMYTFHIALHTMETNTTDGKTKEKGYGGVSIRIPDYLINRSSDD